MRSYPGRLDFVVLRCTFIYQQLGVCYSGDSIKSVQMRWLVQTVPWRPCAKAYWKFSTYLWAFSKGTGQPDAYMRSLARAFAQRCKYFKRVCETVLMFGVPVQKVKDLQRLLRCLFSIENVAHEQ